MSSLVVLEAYNMKWVEMYNVDKHLIENVLHGKCLEIFHVGSTSIPGMTAKPIIDIAVLMTSFDLLTEEVIQQLQEIGYEYVHKEHFPNRRFFRKGEWGAGTHHLHIYRTENKEWKDIITFRNYMRKHRDVRIAYEQLKLKLAACHDRIVYTKLKGPFIQEILQKATKR